MVRSDAAALPRIQAAAYFGLLEVGRDRVAYDLGYTAPRAAWRLTGETLERVALLVWYPHDDPHAGSVAHSPADR